MPSSREGASHRIDMLAKNCAHNTKAFYEHPSNVTLEWDAIDRVRIPAILGSIPQGIQGKSLEVGAAGGKLFRELRGRLPTVTGVDISFQALSSIGEGHRVVANAGSLPFRDRSFELSVSADMLEHLEDGELLPSVREMARVTQRFLIVNVPYQETLGGAMARCMECGREFNVYGHLRRFTRRGLMKLFRNVGFRLVSAATIGPRRKWRSDCLFFLGRRLGRTYSGDFTLCRWCGGTRINPDRNLFHKCAGKLLYLVQVIVDHLLPGMFKPRAEIVMLFEKGR